MPHHTTLAPQDTVLRGNHGPTRIFCSINTAARKEERSTAAHNPHHPNSHAESATHRINGTRLTTHRAVYSHTHACKATANVYWCRSVGPRFSLLQSAPHPQGVLKRCCPTVNRGGGGVVITCTAAEGSTQQERQEHINQWDPSMEGTPQPVKYHGKQLLPLIATLTCAAGRPAITAHSAAVGAVGAAPSAAGSRKPATTTAAPCVIR